MRLLISPGNNHDITGAEALLAGQEPSAIVIADKGYDADSVRACIRDQGAIPNIPNRKNKVSLDESNLPREEPRRTLLHQAEAVPVHRHPLGKARCDLLRLHPACIHMHLPAVN